ncbi:hypothetical protein [Aeromonas phage Akh-2]|nr:hypothetical protein [Aeromonas phage Akh-2]
MFNSTISLRPVSGCLKILQYFIRRIRGILQPFMITVLMDFVN